MKLIPLTKGEFAQIDDEDFNKTSCFKWYCSKRPHTNYAARVQYSTENGIRKKRTIYLHHFIKGASTPTDHIDNNGLNNQKCNLRDATQRQNMYNLSLSPKNKTGFKGVYFSNHRKKFCSTIRCGGKVRYICGEDTAQAAAIKYDEAATRFFGGFAKTNRMLGLLTV